MTKGGAVEKGAAGDHLEDRVRGTTGMDKREKMVYLYHPHKRKSHTEA
jgi:hypothetical protein